jgi:archaellum biogenesis protein FlaJ (TadC family)
LEIGTSKKFLLVLIPSLLFSVYYMLIGKMLEAIVTLSVTGVVVYLLRSVGKKKFPSKIDYNLVTAIFHMYALSMGETSPTDLVETMAKNKEYGVYSSVFQKIRNMAKDFGYGITKATMHMAEIVKPPLKDILIRCTTVFSSVEPKGYLQIESSTLMEEYSGLYSRAIKTLETIGGIFTAFQSVTVFLIMTLSIMAIFMVAPSAILIGYIVAALSFILMFFLFRSIAPRENVVYIGKFPPKLYLGLKWSFIAFVPPSAALAVLVYFTAGAPFAFIVLGVGVLIPGIFGYKLEEQVSKVDRNYPTFLKALGEHLASTADLKIAFTYILYMQLGPLQKFVKKSLERLKLGISHAETMETLSSETASHQVHASNHILIDALSRGANALEIGNALGNRVVKFLEYRRARELVAKSFQTIMLVMQPLTVVLLVVLRVLADFLSSTLVGIPYFGFGQIPIPVVEAGNLALIFIMAVVNALTVKEVSAGHWGTFLLNLGVLLLLSGITWIAAQVIIKMILGSFPSIQLPTT